MSFSINTNVGSLQAQNYLQQSSQFQAQTINEVTSGLRIVNSGDDAAGLAVANGLASDQAILTQGIQNAQNGLDTMHTADGGMSNISTLLDRAQTLATESASGTFTGDRSTLNSEFQSVMTEINRQAQSIGLNTGGTLAQALSVYIGGGQGSTAAAANANGTITVDLSKAAVDTQSLGLTGYTAKGNSAVDIGTGSASTSVAQILAGSSTETQAGYAQFQISGAGFSGSNKVNLEVNMSGVTDANSLASAINTAITSAGTGGTQAATAFKNAGIQASVYTDPTSLKSSLQFTSSSAAFQVQAGDEMGNALLGNISSGTTGSSTAAVTSTSTSAAVAANATAAETVKLGVMVNGVSTTVSASIGSSDTRAQMLTDVNTALNGTGVTASLDGSNKLQFTGPGASSISVTAAGDTNNFLGMGSYLTGGGNISYTSITAASASATGTTADIQVAVGNTQVDLGALATSATEATSLSTLNSALAGNATTKAAGLIAIDNGSGKIEIESTNNTNFRLNQYGDSTDAGFGFTASTAGGVGGTGALVGTSNGAITADSQGTSSSGALTFNGVVYGGSSQTVNLSANDSNGTAHSLSINLTTTNGGNIDSAIATINSAIQQSNDSTLGKVVAVKDQSSSGDQIRFISTSPSFNATLGTTATGTGTLQGISNGTGSTSQGTTVSSSAYGTASTVDISSASDAQNAINALTSAIQTFGTAQAAVGRGENNLNYAVSLAQSESTNEAAAESTIKDANLATEAANLTKAQILMQAGTAALAQANSAPQTLLTLLQHA